MIEFPAKNIYLGIDPGKSGGLAFIHDNTIHVHKCPETMKDMYDLVKSYDTGALVAVLEQVSSMSKQGVKSVWSFSGNYHAWQMLLISLSIPHQLVLPKKWQSYFGSMPKAPVKPKKKDFADNYFGQVVQYQEAVKKHKVKLTQAKKDRKNHIKKLAQQRFPDTKITLATADAVLMAVYCKEVWK